LSVGYARLEPDSGGRAPAAIALFGFRRDGVLVTEAGVPASSQILSGRLYVDINATANTGIAIANTNNQDAVISYYFTDINGTNYGNGTFTLGANQQLATFLNQPPFYGPPSMEGTFTFNSSAPVGVIALRGYTNERSDFLITTLPVIPTGNSSLGSSLVIPHFADGGGWTTHLILTNPSDVPQWGTVQFFGPGSASQNAAALNISVNEVSGSIFNYQIPPRGSIRMVTGNGHNHIQVGSIRITPSVTSGQPSATALFSLRQNGITLTEASITAAPASSAFQVYAELSGASARNVQTGLAITNPSTSAATVTLELHRLDGTVPVPSVTVTIPPGGQTAGFVNEWFPDLPRPFQGVLRATATAPVAMTGLRGTYNERGDFLIATTPPMDESAGLPTTPTILPHVVSGGGYNTQFIMLGQSGAGKLWFMSREGALLSGDTLSSTQ
jgi:hypothetical protein